MFDEITAASGDWAAQVKWLRDNDPDFSSATVVLTGSDAAQLTAASGVLAGRRGNRRSLGIQGLVTRNVLDVSASSTWAISRRHFRLSRRHLIDVLCVCSVLDNKAGFAVGSEARTD